MAAILHLGNIEFETIDKKSEGEGSRVRNPDVLNRVADLIDCDRQVLLPCIPVDIWMVGASVRTQ